MYAAIFASALLGSVNAYGLCDAANYKYAGKPTSAPISGTATKSINVNGQPVAVSVAGTITVVDGCTFSVKGLSVKGPASFQWYGAKGEADGNAVKLVTEDVPSTTTDGTYTFIKTAGNWVNYDDFTQINLYDPVSQSVIGQAVLAAGPTSSTASGSSSSASSSTTTSKSSSTSSASATPTKTSGEISAFGVGASIVSVVLSFFI